MDEQPLDSFDVSSRILSKLRGSITALQEQQLDAWISSDPLHAKMYQELTDRLRQQEAVQELASFDEEVALAKIISRQTTRNNTEAITGSRRLKVESIRRIWWAAASVILVLGVSAYLWFRTDVKPEQPAEIVKATIIEPGKNGALLTLADGSQVLLDSLGNGLVARQNGAQAIMRNGKLEYDAQQSGTTEIVYNTMSTPKGRQFRMSLPDGTQVWLNAASSIRYPTVFSGKDRQVQVTGEVYFEVAADQSKPFFVSMNDSTRVAVLGTSFNVNAYANEVNIRTTLLEGNVHMISAAGTTPLRPGQQAQVQGRNAKVIRTDVKGVMAWKNGQFNFEGATLQEIMRQLERWYDVDVVYSHGIPPLVLHGKMTRDVPLQGLLIGLKEFGLHTQLTGRTLTILP